MAVDGDRRSERRRLLVIDDSALIRAVAEAALAAVGAEVVTAESGRDGIARAAEDRPDAILLDLVMPEGGGLETLRRLRAETATRSVPVILLTAAEGVERDAELQGLGLSGIIAKPFEPATLAARVAEILGWAG
jgi:two-component system, OmpR family, alkaline phosphatase synthesis response regulator PhoP